MKKYSLIFFLICTAFCFAQDDTVPHHGTIKVGKVKQGEVYIKATAKFDDYDLIAVKRTPVERPFQPFPVVNGYAYPFNYTKYFRDNFNNKGIDLKGKETDTVTLLVKVLENGKVYIVDKSKTMMVKGVPAIYDEKKGAFELNVLHLDCINTMKKIKQWFPAYVILPKKDKFRDTTVIKPEKKNIAATGMITIIFSTTPFDEF
ncbi:MAG: hypothetical protein ACJ77K_08685 [Bacteroidia bacterium]